VPAVGCSPGLTSRCGCCGGVGGSGGLTHQHIGAVQWSPSDGCVSLRNGADIASRVHGGATRGWDLLSKAIDPFAPNLPLRGRRQLISVTPMRRFVRAIDAEIGPWGAVATPAEAKKTVAQDTATGKPHVTQDPKVWSPRTSCMRRQHAGHGRRQAGKALRGTESLVQPTSRDTPRTSPGHSAAPPGRRAGPGTRAGPSSCPAWLLAGA
jgi:hypothetical protein